MTQISSSNGVDGVLDITQVPNEDLDQLAAQIESFYKQDSTVKTRLSYNWERNHRFLDGNQWLVFDGNADTGGLWKRLTPSKANSYIPRPVTNYIFDAYQTLKGYLIKNKPRSTVRPNTQTYRDKSAAKIAELVLETNWERLHETENYEYAASCLITYGTVFKKSYWDTSAVSMVKVPRMIDQPQFDPQTGVQVGTNQVPAVDQDTGEEIVDELPLGDINTDVVEPYRIALDPEANDLHKIRWIMEYSIQSLNWIRETYGKEGDGFTGRVDEVITETNLSGSMRRYHELKTSSGVKSYGTLEGTTGNSGNEALVNQAVVKEYYERPSAKYPKGRLVVVANNIPLYAGESPYGGPELGDWHPYSECRWEVLPGRFWGKSPLDAACEIQKQVNSIDAVIILTRKTMAIPQKLIPMSAGMQPGQWVGRPGYEAFYRDGTGNKPEIIPAAGVDSTVFQERSQRVEDIKTVTGAVDILKGDRPPGVTAASALNLLFEVGTGKLYPVLDRWKRFVENDQKKQLKIISKFYQEPRPDFIRALMRKNTELSESAINHFIGSDLFDNSNVIVEAGSNIPKLNAAKQAALQEAAATGVLALDQASNRIEYLRQMGITGFDADIGPDTKRAEWENDLMDNTDLSPDNKPIMLYADNDEIHINVIDIRMKEPSFVNASQAVQQAYMNHRQEHTQQQQQKQQAKQLEALNAQQTGQAPPEPKSEMGPHDSMPLHGAGKGATKEVRNAMATDAVPPTEGR